VSAPLTASFPAGGRGRTRFASLVAEDCRLPLPVTHTGDDHPRPARTRLCVRDVSRMLQFHDEQRPPVAQQLAGQAASRFE
jgi:hypothetical protein